MGGAAAKAKPVMVGEVESEPMFNKEKIMVEGAGSESMFNKRQDASTSMEKMTNGPPMTMTFMPTTMSMKISEMSSEAIATMSGMTSMDMGSAPQATMTRKF